MKYKLLRLPSVIDITGLSRSSIYLKISKNDFPKPINIGDRAVAWLENDIAEWIEARINSSRSS